MRSPLFVSRLAAFTIAVLLLAEAVEPGWGVSGSWGWYLALFFLTLVAAFDLVSLVACVLSVLLLTGLVAEGRPVFIALSVFTGAALLRPGTLRLPGWTRYWRDGGRGAWRGRWEWRNERQ